MSVKPINHVFNATRKSYAERLEYARNTLNNELFRAMEFSTADNFRHDIYLTRLRINDRQAEVLIKEIQFLGWDGHLEYSAYKTPSLTRLVVTPRKETGCYDESLEAEEEVKPRKPWWKLW